MSLQHELLHGHPTRSTTINALLGLAPLAIWFPYAVYRRSHLAHHATDTLTDPDTDPESYFVTASAWLEAPWAVRTLWLARRSVINHASWPWRLLFLNNNLHAVHHDLPAVPWFALPSVYRRHARAYDDRNAGYVVRGYREWWQRFAFTPIDFVAYSRNTNGRYDAERHTASPTERRFDEASRLMPSDIIGAPMP